MSMAWLQFSVRVEKKTNIDYNGHQHHHQNETLYSKVKVCSLAYTISPYDMDMLDMLTTLQ